MKIDEARNAVAALRRLWDVAAANAGGDADALPRQSRFDAFALRPWLPNVILLEVHPGPKRFFYRLTGTRIDEMYGQCFAGRWLEDLRISGSEGYWERNYAIVADTRRPHSGSVAHVDLARNQMMCTWTMLPLAPDLPPRGPGPAQLIILAGIMFYQG
jgi:hypothetical protein